MMKFSVVIPCFNAAKTITGTIESLQAQCYPNWEAICVDDGSTDPTWVQIRCMAAGDSRIRLYRNPGKGPSAARNFGALDIADGDVIAFCDADDEWAPSKLRELSMIFADPSVAGAYGQIAFFSQRPCDARTLSTVPETDLSVDILMGENPVCTMSNMSVRRDVMQSAGGFDETMLHNEDLEWLIRLVAQGARIVGMPMLQTYYRRSTGGLSTDLDAMEAGRERALQTAIAMGHRPSRRSHAIYHRYLARRALRLGMGRTTALRHALLGLGQSPRGFLSPVRRGALTLLGSICAALIPRRFSRSLFS